MITTGKNSDRLDNIQSKLTDNVQSNRLIGLQMLTGSVIAIRSITAHSPAERRTRAIDSLDGFLKRTPIMNAPTQNPH